MSMKHAALNMMNTRMIDIQFKDLTYEIQLGYRGPKKQILNGLNGLFRSGELTAIMGPSGAGKSTLLNILSGFLQTGQSGMVEYIGNKGKQNWDRYKKESCYIQQTDCLYDFFTVQESMMIAAYLKIGNNVTHKFRQMLIDSILDTLNLSKIKGTRTDRLSGGQKKRLSIALELIDNPPVMFLDEPTTGLDSSQSMQCVAALQTLAKNGRTVICTIHQPSAALYQMFDHIYLVTDGQCTYAGTPDDTVSYFARQNFRCPKYHNPADYILEVVNREYGNHNEQLIAAAKQYYRKNETPQELHRNCTSVSFGDESIPVRISPPSELTRFRILLRRCVLLMYRDWTTVHIKIVFHFLVAILLGLTYEQSGKDASKTISNLSYLTVTTLYISYTSMMPAVLKFPLELAILKKERFNNWYQLRTYYAATMMIGLPMQIFASFVYSVVSYGLTSQPLEWSRFFMFLLITALTSCTSESVGLGLGTIFNPVNGTFFGAITTSTMLVFSGFIIFFNHMPEFFYYISYANYFRYSFDGLVQSIYGFHREKLRCPSDVTYCHYRIPSMILEELRLSTPMFWVDVAVLFGWFVVIRIMVYKSLKRRLSKIC